MSLYTACSNSMRHKVVRQRGVKKSHWRPVRYVDVLADAAVMHSRLAPRAMATQTLEWTVMQRDLKRGNQSGKANELLQET